MSRDADPRGAIPPVSSLAGQFRFCPLTARVPVWFSPVLTRTADGGWVYVLDFSAPMDPIPAPTGVSPSSTSAPDPAPFYDLLELVFGWFVYAYLSAKGDLPAQISFDTLTLDGGQLGELDSCIRSLAKDDTLGFDASDLIALLTNSLELDLSEIPLERKAEKLKAAAIPFLPGTEWRFNRKQQPRNGTADRIARDYFVMLAQAAVACAGDRFNTSDFATARSVSALMAAMDAALPSRVRQVGGMARRFLMHGAQIDGANAAGPTYEAAALALPIDPAHDTEVTFELMPLNGPPLEISTASTPASPILYGPARIGGFTTEPAIKTVNWRLLPATDVLPQVFVSRSGTSLTIKEAGDGGGLWRLPKGLVLALNGAGSPIPGFLAGAPAARGALERATPPPLPPASYAFASVIDLVLSRDSGAPDANYYAIRSICDRSRLDGLVSRLQAASPPTLAKVELTYRMPADPTGTTLAVGVVDTSVGLSIHTANPASQGFAAAIQDQAAATDPLAGLLYALQACALTDSSDFYLVVSALASGLPDAAFDSDSTATVSLVVSFAHDADGSDTLAPWHSALRTVATPGEGQTVVAWAPTLTSTRFMPGVISIEMTVVSDDPPTDETYGQTLNALFHRIGLAPVITGGGAPPIDLRNAPLTISPVAGGQPRVYRQTLDLFEFSGRKSSPHVRFGDRADPRPIDPFEAQDPYVLVGAVVDVSHTTQVDSFGNILPLPAALVSGLAPATVCWADDLIPIAQWPGLTTRYRIKAGPDGPVLSLVLDWAPPAPLSQDSINRLVRTYTDIHFQLERIDAVVTTSLLDGASWPQGSAPLAAQLQTFVDAVLGSVAAGKACSTTIDLPAASPSEVNTAPLFPLRSTITLALQSQVPVEPEADSADFTVSSPIYPDPWIQTPASDAAGDPASRYPTGFAADLEAALSTGAGQRDFKLMRGEADEAGDPTYWLLRYGPDAFNLTISTPTDLNATTAPPPLATRLVERPSLPPPPPSFPTNIRPIGPMDLDGSMHRFLDALDTFLKPATAIAADRCSPGVVANVLAAKWTLAQALAAWVLDTSTGEPAAPAAADAWRQAMLNSARTFYTVDGVVTYDMTARIGEEPFTDGLALYGRWLESGPPPFAAVFSPASAILNLGCTKGAAPLALSFTAHDVTASRTVITPDQFALETIRTRLRPMPVPPRRRGRT